MLRLSMTQRALSNRLLSGDESAKSDLSANQRKLESAFSTLAATDIQHNATLDFVYFVSATSGMVPDEDYASLFMINLYRGNSSDHSRAAQSYRRSGRADDGCAESQARLY